MCDGFCMFLFYEEIVRRDFKSLITFPYIYIQTHTHRRVHGHFDRFDVGVCEKGISALHL